MYIIKDCGFEWQVYPKEYESKRLIDARKILYFPKNFFKTIIDVRCYAREYLSIEGIEEDK